MSILNDISYNHSVGYYVKNDDGEFIPINKLAIAEKLKKDLKSLMLDIVGNTELLLPDRPGHNLDVGARNGLRNELRKKINDL